MTDWRANERPTHDSKTCIGLVPVTSQILPRQLFLLKALCNSHHSLPDIRESRSPPAGYLFWLKFKWTLGRAVECTLLSSCASKRPHPHLCVAEMPGLCEWVCRVNYHLSSSQSGQQREETRLTPCCHVRIGRFTTTGDVTVACCGSMERKWPIMMLWGAE